MTIGRLFVWNGDCMQQHWPIEVFKIARMWPCDVWGCEPFSCDFGSLEAIETIEAWTWSHWTPGSSKQAIEGPYKRPWRHLVWCDLRTMLDSSSPFVSAKWPGRRWPLPRVYAIHCQDFLWFTPANAIERCQFQERIGLSEFILLVARYHYPTEYIGILYMDMHWSHPFICFTKPRTMFLYITMPQIAHTQSSSPKSIRFELSGLSHEVFHLIARVSWSLPYSSKQLLRLYLKLFLGSKHLLWGYFGALGRDQC